MYRLCFPVLCKRVNYGHFILKVAGELRHRVRLKVTVPKSRRKLSPCCSHKLLPRSPSWWFGNDCDHAGIVVIISLMLIVASPPEEGTVDGSTPPSGSPPMGLTDGEITQLTPVLLLISLSPLPPSLSVLCSFVIGNGPHCLPACERLVYEGNSSRHIISVLFLFLKSERARRSLWLCSSPPARCFQVSREHRFSRSPLSLCEVSVPLAGFLLSRCVLKVEVPHPVHHVEEQEGGGEEDARVRVQL